MEDLSQYMEEAIIPTFGKWVASFTQPVKIPEAKRLGMIFLQQHVDVSKIKNRGEVYDTFESLAEHAKFAGILNTSINLKDNQFYGNLCTVAKGVVWAVQHDGFDTIKYDNFTHWGKDIAGAM